ncbi:aspartate kinase [Amycolatopsis sp. NPDC021455]|uniref:aspartate kinase n=1 Tax=Amycolatopsis sp. NPDC021455 TaxID=3154901 RepID=UPI00340A8E06
MALIVQKHGGTSVADVDKVKRVAEHVRRSREAGDEVVAVVSAMGGTTDSLLSLANQLSDDPAARELDALVSTGECVSAAALAIALGHLGVPARSLTGDEAGVVTDDSHGRATVIGVEPARLKAELAAGRVPVVAGFQGRSRTTGDRTTLGRGGSDTTAVALAAALGADSCEICSDVDGVFTADPRRVPGAVRIPVVPYPEMAELAACGARVLALPAVEYAWRHEVAVRMLYSAGGDGVGSWVGRRPGTPAGETEDHEVTGIAHQDPLLSCYVEDIAPDEVARLMAGLAVESVEPIMVRYGRVDIPSCCTGVSFVVPHVAAARVRQVLGGREALWGPAPLGRISVVRRGIGRDLAQPQRLLGALRLAAVPVDDLEVTGGRISVLCRSGHLDRALAAVHDEFVGAASATHRRDGAPVAAGRSRG